MTTADDNGNVTTDVASLPIESAEAASIPESNDESAATAAAGVASLHNNDNRSRNTVNENFLSLDLPDPDGDDFYPDLAATAGPSSINDINTINEDTDPSNFVKPKKNTNGNNNYQVVNVPTYILGTLVVRVVAARDLEVRTFLSRGRILNSHQWRNILLTTVSSFHLYSLFKRIVD